MMPVDGGQLRHGIQAFAGVVKADLGTFTFCDKDSGQLMLWVTAIAKAKRAMAAQPAQSYTLDLYPFPRYGGRVLLRSARFTQTASIPSTTTDSLRCCKTSWRSMNPKRAGRRG